MFPSFSLPTTTTWTLLAHCGCFPALSRKGSGSQGQVSTRPLLGGSQVLNEAVSRIGHAVRAHQSSHPLIRLQYFQHSPRWKKSKVRRAWPNYDGDKTSSWRCGCHAISEATHKAGPRPNLLINCSGTVTYGGRDVFKACLKCINTFSTIVKNFWLVYIQLHHCKLRSLCCVSPSFVCMVLLNLKV